MDSPKKSACILIVSPDETVRALIRKALSEGAHKYEFSEADPETAVAVFRTVQVDLLLSDLGTLAATLALCKRAAQASPGTLRIAILPDDEIREYSRELAAGLDTSEGFYRFVRKPWEDALLRVSIQLALRVQRQRAPLTILVVDDEPEVARALRRDLEPGGHTVHVAANGKEALSILEREPVELIISDTMMPQMTGPELMVQAATRWQDTYRVLMSGAHGDSAKAALASGHVHQFIQKPWTPADIEALIARAKAHCRG